MKSMKIDKITSFPFPTSPDKQTVLEAEKRLVLLGALEVDRNNAGKCVNIICNAATYSVHFYYISKLFHVLFILKIWENTVVIFIICLHLFTNFV